MLSVKFLFLFVFGSSLAQLQDFTRKDGAKGPQVVESVVSLIHESCVFPSDRMLLRRWAYFATDDGQKSDTYRPGFNGGIWALTQVDLQQTKTDPKLQAYYSAIRTSFGIDWTQVRWTDLRKPLYSGLAAALYVAHTFGLNVPLTVERQAAWYQTFRFPNQPMAAYNFTKTSQKLNTVCGRSNLDLAFLVDSSSTLSPTDFQAAVGWAADVLDTFSVGPNSVRVAFLTFSTGYKTVFDFDDHSNKADIQSSIRSAQYRPGSTDTDLALGFAATQLFTPARGARLSSAKVAVVVTDGRATHSSDAILRAQELRAKGVIVFVVGLGNQVDQNELNSMATAPACTHVQILKGYQDLDTLRSQIQHLSCRAPVVLKEGNYSFPCDSINNFIIAIHGNETVTIRSSRGKVDIYGSFLTPYPNAAFNEFHTQALTTREAIIYVREESRPLFLSVVSRGSDVTLCPAGNTYDVIVQDKNALRPDSAMTCYRHGILHQCTPLELLSSLYTVVIPNALGFPNPCKAGHPGYYPHPSRTDRFVYCDSQGKVYLVYCPAGHWYNDFARQCLAGNPPTTLTPVVTSAAATATATAAPANTKPPVSIPHTHQPVTTGTPLAGNPCVLAATNGAQSFFPYPQDPHKYIYCTGWPGQGIVKDCAPFHKWSQVDLACIYTDTVVNPTKNIYVTSPRPLQVDCKTGLNDGDLYYHPHPTDPHKFIQCDQFGDAFVMQCTGGGVWSQKMLVCLPGAVGR